MKKIATLILIMAILSGCIEKPQIETRFEQYLPAEDFLVMEKLVKSFNHLVAKEYNGEIQLLLNKIIDEESILQESDSIDHCKLLVEFNNSTLEFKEEKMAYDTVYSSSSFKIGHKEQYSDEPIIITVSQEHDTSLQDEIFIDEISTQQKIDYYKNEGYWNHISESSFVSALRRIDSDDENITTYIDRRESTGNINPSVMAKGILTNNIDVEDYFVKRIIVFELYRNIIKKEHRCE